ncbi:MAG: GNAT family N-acetyltransferase, partial [Anaerolineae bacterium]
MSSKYEVRYLSEADYPAWDRFVDGSTHGGVYSTTGFLRALCAVAGTKFEVLAVWKGSEIHGGVALHFTDSKYGRLVQPRGLLYYNGLVLRDFASKHPGEAASRNLEILRAVAAELEGGRYGSVTLCNRHPLRDVRAFCWQDWVVTPRYTYEVDISDPAVLWERIDQNARRLITRCGNQGMLFAESNDFDFFYRLHLATCLRKGIDPYLERQKFATLFGALKADGTCRMYTATLADGKPVAAQLVLATGHPVTHTWAASTDPEYLTTGASAF